MSMRLTSGTPVSQTKMLTLFIPTTTREDNQGKFILDLQRQQRALKRTKLLKLGILRQDNVRNITRRQKPQDTWNYWRAILRSAQTQRYRHRRSLRQENIQNLDSFGIIIRAKLRRHLHQRSLFSPAQRRKFGLAKTEFSIDSCPRLTLSIWGIHSRQIKQIDDPVPFISFGGENRVSESISPYYPKRIPMMAYTFS